MCYILTSELKSGCPDFDVNHCILAMFLSIGSWNVFVMLWRKGGRNGHVDRNQNTE